MLGHIGFYVDNLQESDKFYCPLLKTIELEVIFEVPQCVAYGKNGNPYFEIYTGKPKSSPIHIAFRAKSREQVDEFHGIGLTLGAKIMHVLSSIPMVIILKPCSKWLMHIPVKSNEDSSLIRMAVPV